MPTTRQPSILRVDAATGETTLDVVDLWLPGRIPLLLARSYRSGREAGPFGHGWSFSLSSQMRLEADHWVVREGSGRQHKFQPVPQGVQAVHGESRLVLQHHADAYVAFHSPRMQQVFPKKNASRGVIPLDHIIDPSGNRVQFRYEGGHLAAIIDSDDRRIVFGRRGGQVVRIQVSDATGSAPKTIRSFRYDGQGDLVTEADAQGREARYTYQKHLMVAFTNRLGGTQYAQYDQEARCLDLWHEDGSMVRTIDLDGHRQNTHVMNGLGYQTTYQHISNQLVLQQVDAFGQEQNYYYDDVQQLRGYSTTDGDTATFQGLDVDDDTLTQLDGEQRLAAFQFDGDGLAQQLSDSNQHAYRYQYDDQKNLTRLTVPQGGSWSFERDRYGRVSQITSPEGRRLSLRWNTKERSLMVEDDLGRTQHARFDLLGRVIERTDGSGRSLKVEYSPTGRMDAVRLGDQYAAQFGYNAAGLLTRVAAEGGATTYQYDSFGRVIRWDSPSGSKWQFRYDREGRIAAARSQQGRTAQIEYDWQGRVKKVTLDGQQILRYTHREGPTTHVDNGEERRTYAFTPLMDPVSWKPGGSSTPLRFSYGMTGEVVEAASDRGSFSFGYDEQYRLRQLLGEETALSCSYDRDGHLIAIQDEDGRRVELRYDRRGRLQRIQGDVQSDYDLQYDAAGRVQVLKTPSGVTFRFAYDALDRLTERTVVDVEGTPLVAHQFGEGEEPIADAFDVQEERADDDPGKARAVLVQGRHGLVLMIHLGMVRVPVLAQGDYLGKGDGIPLAVQIVRANVLGIGALLRSTMPHGRALLQAWETAVTGRFQEGFTQIPGSRDLGCTWTLLDAFFLDRSAYDYHYPKHAPWALSYHREDLGRSADPVVSGSHMTQYLRPAAWSSHAAGAYLRGTPQRFTRGGMRPEDIVHFFDEGA